LRALRVKRVYQPISDEDGTRILVDRLWPRGISKDKARIDAWLKDVSPSDTVRRRFHAKPEHWDEFYSAYAAELEGESARPAVETLLECLRKGPVTLLYAARNEDRNNAVALKAWVEQRKKR
jgi:uncharacterized protein YeaO (DUF488 family)